MPDRDELERTPGAPEEARERDATEPLDGDREVSERTSLLERDSMAAGFVLAIALHVFGQMLLALLAIMAWGKEAMMTPPLFFGWSQLLYMLPAIVWCLVERLRRTAAMLAILTSVAFLVTTGCAALVMNSF